jgi:hypothetical protein
VYLGTDCVETPFLCCSAVVAVETCLFAELLLSDGCYVVAYLAVVAWQRVCIPKLKYFLFPSADQLEDIEKML